MQKDVILLELGVLGLASIAEAEISTSQDVTCHSTFTCLQTERLVHLKGV